MQWVIQKLKRMLRTEKMIGTRVKGLGSDAKFKASGDFVAQRIPQLKEAIRVLEEYKPKKINAKKTPPTITTQLNIFKQPN